MANPFEGENETYSVLVNAKGQHSLWPTFRDLPKGWTAVGPKGKRETCLEWIDAHWTDIRPRPLTTTPN